jgi:hypothetical protein
MKGEDVGKEQLRWQGRQDRQGGKFNDGKCKEGKGGQGDPQKGGQDRQQTMLCIVVDVPSLKK